MALYIAKLLNDAKIQVLVYKFRPRLGLQWSGAHDWLTPHKYHQVLWLVDGENGGVCKFGPQVGVCGRVKGDLVLIGWVVRFCHIALLSGSVML